MLLPLSFRLPRLVPLKKRGAKEGIREATPEGRCVKEGGREGGLLMYREIGRAHV
jgi:hypothetical protein